MRGFSRLTSGKSSYSARDRSDSFTVAAAEGRKLGDAREQDRDSSSSEGNSERSVCSQTKAGPVSLIRTDLSDSPALDVAVGSHFPGAR